LPALKNVVFDVLKHFSIGLASSKTLQSTSCSPILILIAILNHFSSQKDLLNETFVCLFFQETIFTRKSAFRTTIVFLRKKE